MIRSDFSEQKGPLNDALLATGFPYHDFSKMPQYMQLLQDCFQFCRGMRRFGSAATDLAYVACGRFEGFFEYGLNPWDVAAGILLVQEAGGSVTDFKGGDDFIFGKEILAASHTISDELYNLVNKHLG
jgi:myo-inositol-1(or 4)-monophosphatase